MAGCADQWGQAYARTLAHLCLCVRLLSPTTGRTWGWGAAALPLLSYHIHLPPPNIFLPYQKEKLILPYMAHTHIANLLARSNIVSAGTVFLLLKILIGLKAHTLAIKHYTMFSFTV